LRSGSGFIRDQALLQLRSLRFLPSLSLCAGAPNSRSLEALSCRSHAYGIHTSSAAKKMWRRVNNEKNVFLRLVHVCSCQFFRRFVSPSLRKLNLSHNTVASRLPCCCVFVYALSISSAPCRKKWSLSGILPPHPSYRPEGCAQFEPVKFKRDSDFRPHKQPKKPRNDDGAPASLSTKAHMASAERLPLFRPSSEQSPRRHQAGHFAETPAPAPRSCGMATVFSDPRQRHLWRF